MAKRFIFRLEVVRKLRKRKEDECRRLVAERYRRIGRVRGWIGELTDRLHGEHAAIRAPAGVGRHDQDEPGAPPEPVARPLDLHDLRRRYAYVNHLHRSIADAEGELTELGRALGEEQAKLAGASKEVKVLDKLEERQRARHELAIRRREVAEADEIAAQFFRRVRAGAAAESADGDSR